MKNVVKIRFPKNAGDSMPVKFTDFYMEIRMDMDFPIINGRIQKGGFPY
jgi:hypothetical protein